MGKITVWLDAETEEMLLTRLMLAMRNAGKALSMSEVVRKHLEYSFNENVKVVMGCSK